jgi:hypothetical protein
MVSLLIAMSAINPISVNIIVPALTSIAAQASPTLPPRSLRSPATSSPPPSHNSFMARCRTSSAAASAVIGIFVCVLASIVCMVATSIWVVIFGRTCRVGAAASSPRPAMVCDL